MVGHHERRHRAQGLDAEVCPACRPDDCRGGFRIALHSWEVAVHPAGAALTRRNRPGGAADILPFQEAGCAVRAAGYVRGRFVNILLDHSSPFRLAHGGFSVLIEKTAAALDATGGGVDWMRWWDARQPVDLIHYFAPVPSVGYLHQARTKGIPVVLTSLVDWPANQPAWQTRRRRLTYEIINRLPGISGLRGGMHWQSFHHCSRNIVCMQCEKDFIVNAYDVDPARIEVVSPGLADNFRHAEPSVRDGDYLVCTATISTRKRNVRLAQLARETQTPILFIGRPYGQSDPYWKEFAALIDGRYVRHEGDVDGDAALIEKLRHARGFVFMSRVESWCFAASEAAACGLPMLLPRLNWAVERFGDQASYFPEDDPAGEAAVLRDFYARCADLPAPEIEHLSWPDVGRRLREIYRTCL